MVSSGEEGICTGRGSDELEEAVGSTGDTDYKHSEKQEGKWPPF